jgi:hypothetical protein
LVKLLVERSIAMEISGCLFDGKRISSGGQVCEKDRCYVCRDGSWEERFIDRVFGIGP